jgi:AraC-like DNA-binding protein
VYLSKEPPVPDVEWLLREPDRALTLQTGPPFAADDDNWRATIERVIVAPSLHVYLVDAQAHRDMSIEPTHEITDPFVASQLTIEGRADLDFQSAGRAHATRDNTVFFRPPRQTTIYRLKAGTRFRASGYALSVDRMVRLLEGEVPAALAPLLEPELDDTRFVTARSDKVIRSLAGSLFARGLNGPLRRLMMEGAVVHLLALQAAAAGRHAPRHRPAALSPREREAVAEARRLLLVDMRAPPTLGELADAVGLAERRLNAGFRLLFGATVFETLRGERLEHARIAFETGGATLKEAAFRVGYNHVTNFISAFRARYGAPPVQFIGRPAPTRAPRRRLTAG